MEKNEELQRKARDGEVAIKGTREPDVTTEPVAPARPMTAEDALRLKLGDRGPDGPDDED